MRNLEKYLEAYDQRLEKTGHDPFTDRDIQNIYNFGGDDRFRLIVTALKLGYESGYRRAKNESRKKK